MHGMAVNQKFLSNPAFSLDHFTFRTSNGSVCYCSLYKESFYSIIESCQKCFQNFALPYLLSQQCDFPHMKCYIFYASSSASQTSVLNFQTQKFHVPAAHTVQVQKYRHLSLKSYRQN